MRHPLLSLAERLGRRAARGRTRHAIEQVQADPYLARDIGLPYRDRSERRISLFAAVSLANPRKRRRGEMVGDNGFEPLTSSM